MEIERRNSPFYRLAGSGMKNALEVQLSFAYAHFGRIVGYSEAMR